MEVTVNPVAEVAALTAALASVEDIATRIEDDPSIVSADLMDEVEAHFAAIRERMWTLDPSENPTWTVRWLQRMPGNIDEWFRNWLVQNELEIPPVSFVGPVRTWLCPSL
jgi:hypothetical protein